MQECVNTHQLLSASILLVKMEGKDVLTIEDEPS